MQFSRTGVILCTENYRDCVSFYSEILGLPVMFTPNNEYSKLTSLDMGGGEKASRLPVEYGRDGWEPTCTYWCWHYLKRDLTA